MMQANEDLEQMKSEYSDTSITVADAARELIKEIDIRRKLPNPLVGLSFGNKQLDEMTGGAHIESLYLIAGAGGDGKTTLALQFAVFMSKYHKVDYYSLEMSVRQLTPKILSAGTGISKSSILHASVGDDQIKILSSEADNIEKTGIHIIDTIYDLNSLESSIRGRIKRNNTDAIFIDNRTNIRHNLKGSSTDDITIMLTYRFKNLAMEIKKPIFLLVHKNKESTSRADKRPTSSDIKYGGDIAADVIIFPYQPKNLEEPDKYGHYKYSEIVITKNRVMGDSGHIESLFDPDYDSYYCFGYDEKPIRNYNPYENSHNLNMDEKPKEAVNPNLITRQHAPADKEEIPF